MHQDKLRDIENFIKNNNKIEYILKNASNYILNDYQNESNFVILHYYRDLYRKTIKLHQILILYTSIKIHIERLSNFL